MPLTEVLRSSDDYIIGTPPQVLETQGVYPCIVIAMYSQGVAGVLGHFAEPKDSMKFHEMMAWIKGNLEISELEVTLTGASYEALSGTSGERAHIAEINQHRKEKRDYVIDAFIKLQVQESHITKRFIGKDQAADVSFDTTSGNVEIIPYDVNKLISDYLAEM